MCLLLAVLIHRQETKWHTALAQPGSLVLAARGQCCWCWPEATMTSLSSLSAGVVNSYRATYNSSSFNFFRNSYFHSNADPIFQGPQLWTSAILVNFISCVLSHTHMISLFGLATPKEKHPLKVEQRNRVTGTSHRVAPALVSPACHDQVLDVSLCSCHALKGNLIFASTYNWRWSW